MEYRTNLSYAKEDPASPNPTFNTLDEWEKKKSTKMTVCAQLCQYYLYRDDVPDVEFHDGKPVLLKVAGGFHPNSKGHQRTRKILIYSEFPSLTPLLKNVRGHFYCLSRH